MRPGRCARVLTRLKRRGRCSDRCPWGGRLSTEDMQGAWWGHRKNRGGEPDRRGPTAFLGRKPGDTHRDKATAAGRGEAAASAGRSVARAPWGFQRVRRRSPLGGAQEATPTREAWTSRLAGVQCAHGEQPRKVLPSFAGTATGGRRTDATAGGSRASVGLRTAEHGDAQGPSTHTPGACAHWQEHPRHAAQRLQGGQAASRGGRARHTGQQEVRSQSGRAPLGAEARTAGGHVPTDPAPAGVYAAGHGSFPALGEPRRAMARGPGEAPCRERAELCTALS
jgi:hypothetical protein